MTCKDCIHKEACGGFTPTDLDQDVFDYCREGRTDEIPDIEERCECFKNKADFVEVVRCEKCNFRGTEDCPNGYYLECEGAYVDPMEDDDFCSYGERRNT